MKEIYITPELEVLAFETEDVITTSARPLELDVDETPVF